MPEKTQKRKLRSDQSTSQIDEEIASSTNDENVLSDRDFEDIPSKVENRLSKRLRDTEVNQREITKIDRKFVFQSRQLNQCESWAEFLNPRD